jgi:hypothetical protein
VEDDPLILFVRNISLSPLIGIEALPERNLLSGGAREMGLDPTSVQFFEHTLWFTIDSLKRCRLLGNY